VTDRQRAVLTFFTAYTQREGVPPSVREVGAHFGITPKATFDHLCALARQGHLRRRRARSARGFILAHTPDVARLRAQVVRLPIITDPIAMKTRVLQLIDHELGAGERLSP